MKWFIKVIKDYKNFDGRASRKEYWMFYLFYMIFLFAIIFLCGLINFFVDLGYFVLVPIFAYILALFIPGRAVMVRRMHDIGEEVESIRNSSFSIIDLIKDSQYGYNEFGPNPKGIGNDETFPTEVSVEEK